LARPREVQCLAPIASGKTDWRIALAEELPHGVTAVRMAKGAGEHGPICSLARIVIIEPAQLLRLPIHRVILVARLAIQAGLCRQEDVIAGDDLIIAQMFSFVARLSEIEVQPRSLVKPLGRAVAAVTSKRMEGHQVVLVG